MSSEVTFLAEEAHEVVTGGHVMQWGRADIRKWRRNFLLSFQIQCITINGIGHKTVVRP